MENQFKPGDLLVYVDIPGYAWVKDYIDSDLVQTVKEVIETDGHTLLKLEDIRTHKVPVPSVCFDYESDCEDCWCGGPIDDIQLELGARSQEGIVIPFDYPNPEDYAKHQEWLKNNLDIATKPAIYANPAEWEAANPEKGPWMEYFYIWL